MLPWLNPNDDLDPFPTLESALDEPNGLLAAGGALTPKRLLSAYQHGIFPWFEEDQPILWWSPDPRLVLKPSELYVSSSLKKQIRKAHYRCTIDIAFKDVMSACASPRDGHGGTWITPTMLSAYLELHALGHAHSIEVWLDGDLVGGLYGIAIGQAFFGESMFSRQSNASKIGFAFLCKHLDQWGFKLIDCQVESDHLLSLGAYNMPRQAFSEQLALLCPLPVDKMAWHNE
jgi:leucyl/phenylalanyl-tRNA--protein transferase